eukprot:8198851-Alexandrium_andersonii.AAC.1
MPAAVDRASCGGVKPAGGSVSRRAGGALAGGSGKGASRYDATSATTWWRIAASTDCKTLWWRSRMKVSTGTRSTCGGSRRVAPFRI